MSAMRYSKKMRGMGLLPKHMATGNARSPRHRGRPAMTKPSNFDPSTIPLGYTRDDNGRVLTYRDEAGLWFVFTRDAAGRMLTYRNNSGFWRIATTPDLPMTAPTTTAANAQSHAHARGRQHD